MSRLLFFLLLAAAGLRAAPNVLFIAVDDLRPELGCYGEAHMHTPNIDSLASQGRLFRNHYVAVPTCGASRYALMSGLRPTASTDGNDAFNQMPSSPTSNPESWVELLRRNGWRTVSIGKVAHEPDGYRWNYPSTYDIGRSSATHAEMRFSWDEILYGHDKWGAQRYPLFAYADGNGRVSGSSPAYEVGVDAQGQSLPDDAYPDGQTAQAAIAKLREFADDGDRFCLAVGFFKPHLPFNAPKAYYDLYDPAGLPAPFPAAKPVGATAATVAQSGEPNAYTSTGDRAALRRAYFACVSYVDAQIGKVLAELDALGLRDNTLVILWGDHGWCLDDYSLLGKHIVLERGVHSPLIVRAPAGFAPQTFAGVAADGLVETIDLYPTIAELCGLDLPAGPEGRSFAPLVFNPFAPGKNHAYSRIGSTRSVRTPDWRLVETGGTSDLYDLSTVRYELEDVAASNPGVVGELNAALSVAGTRPTTTYDSWSAGKPLLADPGGDADHDGCPNRMEYAAGSDALDPGSKPSQGIDFEDLSHLGLSDREPVFTFTALAADDLLTTPLTSTDLINWAFDPLLFLDATEVDGALRRLRFRVPEDTAERRFFRFEISPR
ncbi:MAG: sulfatase [Akkermansiaceae bacterium]|nr:sulfatase [Akkermansiaceae bacterium]